MMEIEGLVLELIPFKESDAMVRCLTASGLLSFYGRRVMKHTSPDHAATTPFARSRFWINEGAQHGLALSQSRLLTYYGQDLDNLDQYALLDLIKETLVRSAPNDDWIAIHELVFLVLAELKKKAPARLLAAWYLARLLNILGWRLEVDACVICGKTSDIVAVDIGQGGFVCRNHYQAANGLTLPPLTLKSLRLLFKIEDGSRLSEFIDADAISPLLKLLGDHYAGVTGRALRSLELYK